MKQVCWGCFESYDDALDICPYCGYGNAEESAAEAPHLEPGNMLKEIYKVGRVLGYGGFGVTYLCWDTVLEQKVAIKEYLPSEFSTRMPGHTKVTVFTGDKADQFLDGAEKFVDEANRLAQFRNTDGIVRIYESFRENDTAYIVMEYLEGQTLKKHLEATGQLSADEAVRLMTPIMQSLQFVHKQGIIHRDIAPDNIILTADGRVKLIDFGAARYATTSHSRSLTVVVKPGYSPEEQYRSSGDQGPWTDVYALGATMYRMVTGLVPPDAMERRATFESKEKDILLPPSKLTKHIGVNQEKAILNAMNVRIEDRTADMATFESELNSQGEVQLKVGKIKKIDRLKWPLWAKIAIPAALSLVIALSALLATDILFPTKIEVLSFLPQNMTMVPSLISMTVEQAEARADEYELSLMVTGREKSKKIKPNYVLKQNLTVGSIVENHTKLEVTISEGEGVDVNQTNSAGNLLLINACYMTEKEARNFLNQQDIKDSQITIIKEFYEKADKDLIYKQEPEANEPVTPGMEVTLWVSKGPPTFNMPNVVGFSEKDALKKLGELKLIVITDLANSDSVQPGLVIAQSVKKDAQVSQGDEVVITVSSGKELKDVPKVTGLSINDAYKKLKDLGFEVQQNIVVSSKPKDEVVSQKPETPATREKGSLVIINVSGGQCAITLDAQQGSVSPGTVTVNVGGTPAGLPQPSRTHYSFVGWFTSASGGSQVTESTVIEVGMTLFARWTQVVYTVTYDPNGGNMSQTTQQVAGGSGISLLSAARTYYTFLGWYTAAIGGSKVADGAPVNGNMTLYAHWERTRYTITFNANGGAVSPASQQVDAGSTLGTLPTPQRNYYNFSGWYTSASGGTKVTSGASVPANMTLYARWELKPLSGNFVAVSAVPSGAQIVEYKWTYTLTTVKESTSTTMSGFERTGSRVQVVDQGSINTADFPNQDLRNWYPGYCQSLPSGARVTNTTFNTYVYWHYCYSHNSNGDLVYGPVNGYILDYGGWSSANGPWLNYDCFHALVSARGDYAQRSGPCWVIYAPGSCPYNENWLRTAVYTKTWVKEVTYYQFTKVEQKETAVTSSHTAAPSGTGISNQQEVVRYRPK